VARQFPSRRRSPCAKLLSLAAAVPLLAACVPMAPPPGEVPPPTFELLPPAPPEDAPFGEPVVIRFAVRGAGGEPYPDAETRWLWTDSYSVSPAGRCDASTPEPGVFQCTYHTTRRGWHDVKLEVSRCVGTPDEPKQRCASFESEPVAFRVWGGPPVAVHTPYATASLVVGEERPLQGLSLTQRAPSHVMPVATVDDATVAEVLSGNVVRALAFGQTTLRLRAGTVEREVSLTVLSGTPGPPPPERPFPIVRSDDDTVSSIRWMNLGASRHRDGTVALDRRGWPWLVYQTTSNTTSAGAPSTRGVWLSGWTGSGFGYEYVGAGWDNLTYPRIAVDDQDVAWVLAWSSDQSCYVLMRRAGPGQWSRHPLPVSRDPSSPTPPRGATSVVFLGDPNTDFVPVAMVPRRGGGVFVAFPVAMTIQPPVDDLNCAHLVRLVTVAPDGALAAEDVPFKHYAAPGMTDSTCIDGLLTERHAIDHLALAPDPATPTGQPVVLATRFSETSGFTDAARFDGTTWSVRRVIPWADPVADLPTASKQFPIQLSVAAPDGPSDAPAPTYVLWQGGGIRNFYRAELADLLSGSPTPFTGFSLMPELREGTSDHDVTLTTVSSGGPLILGVVRVTPLVTLIDDQQRDATLAFDLGGLTRDTFLRGLAADSNLVHFTWGLGDLAWAAFPAP
jgi:hypothetical protein